MAWPTSKPDSNKFSSDGDSIKDSRPELKTMSDAVNNIVDFVDTTGISNGDVLVYDSATDTIKPGAGGGGGVTDPLSDDLETGVEKIGNFGSTSLGGSHIGFSRSGNIDFSGTSAATSGNSIISLRNYMGTTAGLSERTGNKWSNPDYGDIQFYAEGPQDSKDDSANWNVLGSYQSSRIQLYKRGDGFLLKRLNTSYEGDPLNPDSAGEVGDTSLIQQILCNYNGLKLSTSGGGTNWSDAERSIAIESEKNVTIRGAVVGDSVFAGNNPVDDEGTIKLVADNIEIEGNVQFSRGSITYSSASPTAGYVNGGIQTTNFNAQAGYSYIMNGLIQATLPASPNEGDRISFVSITTSAWTVARNGNNIDGAASDYTSPGAKSTEATFIYTNASEGWQVV